MSSIEMTSTSNCLNGLRERTLANSCFRAPKVGLISGLVLSQFFQFQLYSIRSIPPLRCCHPLPMLPLLFRMKNNKMRHGYAPNGTYIKEERATVYPGKTLHLYSQTVLFADKVPRLRP